jgi:bifunctional ADP-heptose synthase (sugar kinase/adenylyltransferase)
MLDAIKYVDYVIVFNDETPLEYITKLLPNVLVK